MASAIVLGERGCGLTTFVGLLYTAQVRLGTENSDEFRFHAERESIQQMEAVYGELGAGRFPAADIDWERHPLSFVFGFRRGRAAWFAGSGGSGGHGFSAVRLQVGGMPAEAVAELRDHDAVLDAGILNLLRSPIQIPIIDGAWLVPDRSSTASLPLARYDQHLAGTLELLRRFLAADRDRKARQMFPVFVVTKFDRIRPETFRALDTPSGLPDTWSLEERQAVGGRILRGYLPATADFLARKNDDGVRLAEPSWFFSSLRTEERGDELLILRRRISPVSGWEPEYPFEEYRGLLARLGELAGRLPVWSPSIEGCYGSPGASGVAWYRKPSRCEPSRVTVHPANFHVPPSGTNWASPWLSSPSSASRYSWSVATSGAIVPFWSNDASRGSPAGRPRHFVAKNALRTSPSFRTISRRAV